MNESHLSRVFLFGIIALLLAACADTARNKLRFFVEEVNKECPQKLGNLGIIEAVRYNTQQNTVSISYALSDEAVKISALAEAKDAQKAFLYSFLRNDKQKEFLDLLLQAETSMAIVYKDMASGDSISLYLSHDEIKQIAAEDAETGKDIHQLEAMVAISNSQCPFEISQGLVFTGITIEDGYLCYRYTFDPELYAFTKDNEEQVTELTLESFRESLSEDSTGQFQLGLMKACAIGVRYVYTPSSDDGEPLTVTIGPETIAGL